MTGICFRPGSRYVAVRVCREVLQGRVRRDRLACSTAATKAWSREWLSTERNSGSATSPPNTPTSAGNPRQRHHEDDPRSRRSRRRVPGDRRRGAATRGSARKRGSRLESRTRVRPFRPPLGNRASAESPLSYWRDMGKSMPIVAPLKNPTSPTGAAAAGGKRRNCDVELV